MIVTPYIADLIDKGRVDEIKSAMEKAQNNTSQTFDQALYELVVDGRISQDEALRQADSPNNLALRFRLSKTGAASGYPVKSEFTLDKKAPLEQYGSFQISPLKVQGGRPDAEAVLSEAISHVLTNRGLVKADSDPDMSVQFVYGIKKTKGLALEPIGDEQEAFEQYQPETERHVMLVINVVDGRSRKPVYRLTASRRESDSYPPQPEVNRLMEELLATLPVGH